MSPLPVQGPQTRPAAFFHDRIFHSPTFLSVYMIIAGAPHPLLASGDTVGGCRSGPGHQAVLQRGQTTFLAYHAWESGPGCTPGDPRHFLHIGEVRWQPRCRGLMPWLDAGLTPP